MKIYTKTFGCRVNQTETQYLIEQSQKAGHEITSDYKTADICIINTCTVTAQADKDARRMFAVIARDNPNCRIIATGCLAQINAGELKEKFPNLIIAGNNEKQNIPAMFLNGKKRAEGFGWEITSRLDKSRAFVKIQDGCSDGCNYCIVWKARPVKTSKPLDDAVSEIQNLADSGYREIVLCGINIGNYLCPHTGADLADLLQRIFNGIKGNFRIRLSSIEPGNLSEKLLKVAKEGGGKFCPYFHIPLQSGSVKVLKEMGRRYDAVFYLSRLEVIRKTFPSAGLFADVIAGYPTETEKDFNDTARFIISSGLCGLHIFSFSPRKGTPAAELKQLPAQTIRKRADYLRKIDIDLRAGFAQSLIGTTQNVLIEKTGKTTGGVAANFQRVEVKTGKPLSAGKIYKVKITAAENVFCRGEIIRRM